MYQTYNHLNLPVEITFSNGNITYLYNATGQKVKKIVTEGTTITTTDYLSNFQYKNTILQFFPHAEGYLNAKMVKTSYKFNYVFNFTDHLGNIRLSYTKDPVTNVLKIIEENHYYPFGLKHTNYNSDMATFKEQNETLIIASTNTAFYKYKYNGKEYQDELGLNMYDYGARNYDPALGRYFTLDNFSEAFYNINPYQYTANNPVKFIDVNGDYIYIFGEDGTRYKYDNGKTYSQDKEGAWNEYTAKDGSYVAQIVGALNELTQGDENSFGSQFLN